MRGYFQTHMNRKLKVNRNGRVSAALVEFEKDIKSSQSKNRTTS